MVLGGAGIVPFLLYPMRQQSAAGGGGQKLCISLPALRPPSCLSIPPPATHTAGLARYPPLLIYPCFPCTICRPPALLCLPCSPHSLLQGKQQNPHLYAFIAKYLRLLPINGGWQMGAGQAGQRQTRRHPSAPLLALVCRDGRTDRQ